MALVANIAPFDAPAPGPINIRSFRDLKDFLINYVVNDWMQYVSNYMRNQMLPTLNTAEYNYGPDIANAATITPSALVQTIAGSGACWRAASTTGSILDFKRMFRIQSYPQ